MQKGGDLHKWEGLRWDGSQERINDRCQQCQLKEDGKGMSVGGTLFLSWPDKHFKPFHTKYRFIQDFDFEMALNWLELMLQPWN